MNRRLNVELDRLAMAFDERSPEVEWYLDRESGEVIAVDYDTWRLLEEVEAGVPDGVELPAIADLVSRSALPQWQRDTVLDAARVRDDFPGRMIAVPRVESHEAYEDMQAFVDTVQNVRLHENLAHAIVGRGAFRRFRDRLAENEREERRWYAFQAERTRARITEWLASEGIEPE